MFSDTELARSSQALAALRVPYSVVRLGLLSSSAGVVTLDGHVCVKRFRPGFFVSKN